MAYFHHMRVPICMIGLLASTVGWAQNLVPNGSFEEYSVCPSYFGFAHYAVGWQNLYNNSSDYFNRCDTGIVASVPFNTCGHQEPADGDAYIGLVTTFPGLEQYREIVGIKLAEPLQAGIPVCLSFQMAVGGFGSWNIGSAVYTAKGVGLSFFMSLPSDWATYLYPDDAALYLDEVPMDTAIWYAVSGMYIPDSNYTHLVVGNFFSNAMSGVSELATTGFGAFFVSYAFIDDVRVSFDMEYCISTSAPSGHNHGGIRVHPNPGAGRFIVNLPTEISGRLQWQLVDAYGKVVFSGIEMVSAGAFAIEVRGLASGAYMLWIKDDFGAYAPVRLLSVSP